MGFGNGRKSAERHENDLKKDMYHMGDELTNDYPSSPEFDYLSTRIKESCYYNRDEAGR
jgi:hypothetical protein